MNPLLNRGFTRQTTRNFGLSDEQLVQKLPPSDLTLSGGQNMPVAPRHHLLPHERWFASLILERQRTHRNSAAPRNPATLRMEQNYGPEGIALWAAGMITVLPGMLLGFLGFACLVASGGHPWQLVNWLYGIGITLILLSEIRFIQGIRAGRAFRGGRPFLK